MAYFKPKDSKDTKIKLSTDEVDQVLRFFHEIDLNASGQLSRVECTEALGQLGVETFDLLDADKDGFVDLREWKRFMREVKREKGQDEFSSWTAQLVGLLADSSHRRQLKLEKRKEFRAQMGAAPTSPPKHKSTIHAAQLTHRQTEAALALFAAIDADHSGMISYSELKECSLDDHCWRILDTDMNGDVGLREWMAFLRKTKTDRGSKGLNHWMVDMENNITHDKGCGVHKALYESESHSAASMTDEGKYSSDGLATLPTQGFRMSVAKPLKDSLTKKDRALSLKVFNSMDLDRSGFIDAWELESVCGKDETLLLLMKMGIREADFDHTEVSMHQYMGLMATKKKESRSPEMFIEWLEEMESNGKLAADKRIERMAKEEENKKQEEEELRNEHHDRVDHTANILTDTQRTRGMALFKGIDDDGNGTLERHEMERACGDIATVDIESILTNDVNGDNRVDMAEWLKWLRAFKQEQGNGAFENLMNTIETEGNIMRAEEGDPEPEYDDTTLSNQSSNMFKYRLSQDQRDEASALWLRLDDSLAGMVPWKQIVQAYIHEDLSGFSREEAKEELDAAKEALALLSQNQQGFVTPSEWTTFFRRVKQQGGDDGIEMLFDRFSAVLPEEGAPVKKGSDYLTDTRINMHAARMKQLRKKQNVKLMPRDKRYPKTKPSRVPIKDSPKKPMKPLSVYIYPNDGVHEGQYRALVSVPTAGVEYEGHMYKGFTGLLKQCSIVLGQKNVHRIWTLDGCELTAGAGAAMYKRNSKGKVISRWTPGMECVAGGREDFKPNDVRSLASLERNDPRLWATIQANLDNAQDEADQGGELKGEELDEDEHY